jgi:DNA-binding NarL/FixJ family response regulator
MRRLIAILEDKPERLAEMTLLLREIDAEADVVNADNAHEFIDLAVSHFDSLSLISLDHDLGASRTIRGQHRDPGDGRDVARALALRRPQCPIVIHSTNIAGAESMRGILTGAGWTVGAILPYCDLEWVRDAWLPVVRRELKL